MQTGGVGPWDEYCCMQQQQHSYWFLSLLLLLYTAMTSCHLSCLHCESSGRSNKKIHVIAVLRSRVAVPHLKCLKAIKESKAPHDAPLVFPLYRPPPRRFYFHIRLETSHRIIYSTHPLKSDTMTTTTHTPTSMHRTNSSSCLPCTLLLHQDTSITHSCRGRGEENKPWFEESNEGWYYPLQQQQQQQPWIWLDDQQDDEQVQSRGCHGSRITLVCANSSPFGYVHPHGMWVLAWIERYLVPLSTEIVGCHCQYQCPSNESPWSIWIWWSRTTCHVYTQCRRSMSSERGVVCGADRSIVWCATLVDRDGNWICHFGSHHWLCMPYW